MCKYSKLSNGTAKNESYQQYYYSYHIKAYIANYATKIKLRIPIKIPSLANVPTTRITKYRSPRPKAPAAKN